MGVLVLVALAIPFVLGVRDWRCYGLLLLWPPVISAVQTGNVTLWFALAAALAWRFRDRTLPWRRHRADARGEVLPVAARRLARGVAPGVERGGRVCRRRDCALRLVGRHRVRRSRRLPEPPRRARGGRRRGLVHRSTSSGSTSGSPSPVARVLWLGIGLALVVAVIVLGTTRRRADGVHRRRSLPRSR